MVESAVGSVLKRNQPAVAAKLEEERIGKISGFFFRNQITSWAEICSLVSIYHVVYTLSEKRWVTDTEQRISYKRSVRTPVTVFRKRIATRLLGIIVALNPDSSYNLDLLSIKVKVCQIGWDVNN